MASSTKSPDPRYPYWSNSEQNWYRVDGKNRRYRPRSDSGVGREGSSRTSGSPGRSVLESITAGIEAVSLSGKSTNSKKSNPFQERSEDFYKRGRVFATARQAVQSRDSHTGQTVASYLDISADQETNRYYGAQRCVVIGEEVSGDSGQCYVLPISTYNGSGVAKQGVVKADHGIIHSGKKRNPAPDAHPSEEPRRGEAGMCATAVRVEMRLPSDKLDPMSRINYKTPHTFDKSTPVHFLGDVDKDSMAWLVGNFQSVQAQPQRSKAPVREAEAANESDEEDDDEADDSSRTSRDLAAEAQFAKNAYRRMLNQGESSEQAISSIAQMLQQQYPTIRSWQEAVAAAKGRLRYPPDAIPNI